MNVDGVFHKDKIALVMDHLHPTRILNRHSIVMCKSLLANMRLAIILT